MNYFARIYKYVSKAEGWLSEQEAQFLYQIAKKASPKGEIVEIGSFKGKSTICLAFGSKEKNREKVYAIDPHKGVYTLRSKEVKTRSTYADFRANLKSAGVDDWVVPVVKTSEEAWKGWKKKIRVLFIDGLHDYKNAYQDYKSWSEWIVDGGVIALHDAYCGYEGPRQVFTKKILASPKFSSFGIAGSILYARKTPAASILEKLHTKKFQILLPFIFKLGKFSLPHIVSTIIFHKFFRFMLTGKINFLLIGAIITALFLRLWSINAGLPYVPIHLDERALIYTTLAMVPLKGVLWTIGPGLFIPDYLLFLYGIYFFIGKFLGIFSTPESFYIAYLKDPTYFYLIGRAVSVVFGVATVWMVYKAGKEWFNRRIGILAAWFLSVSFLHAKESHYIKGDVLGGLIAILLFHFSCRIAKKAALRDYIITGILSGIAFGVKYFTVIPVVCLIASHWIFTYRNKRFFFNKNFLLFLTIGIITTILQAPITFLRRPNVLEEFIRWGRLVADGVASTSIPVAATFAFDHVREGIGTFMFFLALVGMLFAIIRIKHVSYFLLILFPLTFLASVEFWAKFNLPRYAIILFPSFVILAAIGTDGILQNIKSTKIRNAAFILLCCIAMYSTSLRSIKFNRYMDSHDTGMLAKEWIEKNIPEGSKIAVEGMLRPDMYGAVPLDISGDAIKREIQRANNHGADAISLSSLLKANKDKKGYDIYATTRIDLKRNFLTGEEKALKNVNFYVKEGYNYIVRLNWAENPSLNKEFESDLEVTYEKIKEFNPTINFSVNPHIQQIEYQKIDALPLFRSIVSGPQVAIHRLSDPLESCIY